MNQLSAMRAFRSVVEAGGFSAAALRLDTTHSTVSRQLQQLEALLGVCLVQRNTRHLSLTAAGEEYFQVCVEVLDRLEAASLSLKAAASRVSGVLRVSVPLTIATLELSTWLPAWCKAFPKVQLQLCGDDRFVDLVAENFDVALRITSTLADTTLKARLLTSSEVILVASPGYVQVHGLPRSSGELADHHLLAFAGTRQWSLHDSTAKRQLIKPDGLFKSDTVTVLHAAALAGVGIAAFTQATVQADLNAGRLIRILPGCTLGELHYYAMYPQSRHLPPQARAFIDFMAQHYSNSLV